MSSLSRIRVLSSYLSSSVESVYKKMQMKLLFSVPDRDDHLHPGRNWAGMTLNSAGTAMIPKTRSGPGSGSSRPGYRDSNRDLNHFLMLYVPHDVNVHSVFSVQGGCQRSALSRFVPFLTCFSERDIFWSGTKRDKAGQSRTFSP